MLLDTRKNAVLQVCDANVLLSMLNLMNHVMHLYPRKRQFCPERLAELAPPCDPAPMTLGQVTRVAYRHLQSRRIIADRLSRFPDPYVARF